MTERSYRQRIKAIHRKLGIPADYVVRWGLEIQPEASTVIAADHSPDGEKILLTPDAATRWKAIKTAAQEDGIYLHLESGFRSVDAQAELMRSQLRQGEDITDLLTWIAAPGHSEHHTGYALDIGSEDCYPVDVSFKSTEAYEWLQKHKDAFGISLSYPQDNPHKIIFEPWHWLLNHGSH
jgi:zinc D-Ala-D-Ala carboxypeptidase